MAAYSEQIDLLQVLPNATGYVPSGLDPDDYFDSQREWAAQVIDDRICSITAVPSSEDLSEIEANLVAHRLLRQNFASKDMEGSRDFINQYKKDALDALEGHRFPATASTPEKLQDFAGNGSLAVTVYDQWTYTTDWVVKCSEAGTSTAKFEVWNEVKGVLGYYDLAEDAQFPDADAVNASTPSGLLKEIKLVITAGVTAFSVGDSWSFRTYARRRLKTPRGLGSIPIRRG
jgi:hypothetical protein